MRIGDKAAGVHPLLLIDGDLISLTSFRADIVCHWEDTDVVAQEMFYNVGRKHLHNNNINSSVPNRILSSVYVSLSPSPDGRMAAPARRHSPCSEIAFRFKWDTAFHRLAFLVFCRRDTAAQPCFSKMRMSRSLSSPFVGTIL